MGVERLQEEFSIEVDACAFDLRPGLPPAGLPREQLYPLRNIPEGYVDHLRQRAANVGIEMGRPETIANTRKAHEATEFARDAGRLREFQRAVFRAYWERGENIGLVDVLCRLAEGCGLDGQALRQALEDGRYAGRVERQMAWAKAVGVTGVPTFVFNDRFAVVGAQEYQTFREIAGRIARGEIQGEG